MLNKHLHEENRLSWNEGIETRESHKGDIAKFFREGGNTLHREEKELLGDIAGLSIVHLQCNCGEDTLSLAQLGATVSGVDISDSAISFARKYSEDSGIPATFHRMDVYDWLEETGKGTQRFDVVFSSYGVIFWLSDIKTWAKGIKAVLKPGGRFVMVEVHPVLFMFEHDWTHKFPYFNVGTVRTWEEGIVDCIVHPSGYIEDITDFQNPNRTHEFHWGVGEVVTALLEAGLTIISLLEYPFAKGSWSYEGMRETPEHRWIPPERVPNMPLMYSIVARKS